MRKAITILVIAAALGGCTFTQKPNERMFRLASVTTKLAAAVEAEALAGEHEAPLSEADLLMQATDGDPALRQAFSEYRVRVLQEAGHTAVLVCTPDGDEALLEDSGCKRGLEVHRWQVGSRPCDFTLDLGSLCNSD